MSEVNLKNNKSIIVGIPSNVQGNVDHGLVNMSVCMIVGGISSITGVVASSFTKKATFIKRIDINEL